MKPYSAIIKYLIFFIIGVGLFLLAIINQDPDELVSGFVNANYTYVILAMLAAVISTISRAIRWTMLINPFGFKISVYNSFMAIMSGYLANLAIPRIGEITRCVVLNKTHQVPVNKLVGTVVVERAIDLLCILILLIYVLIFELDKFKSFFSATGFKLPGLQQLFTTQLLLIVLALLIVIAVLFYFYKKNKKGLFWYRLTEQLKGFITGLKSIKTIKNYRWFIFHTVFIWFSYVIMTYACFYAIESTSHLGLSTALFVMVIGTFGFIAPVQGGIGTYHWLVQESLYLFEISRANGLVFATIAHAAQTFFIIVFGGFSFLMFLINKRKKEKIELSEENKK